MEVKVYFCLCITYGYILLFFIIVIYILLLFIYYCSFYIIILYILLFFFYIIVVYILLMLKSKNSIKLIQIVFIIRYALWARLLLFRHQGQGETFFQGIHDMVPTIITIITTIMKNMPKLRALVTLTTPQLL